MNRSGHYENFTIESFWSACVESLVNALNDTESYSHATHHDLGLHFVNDRLLNGKGQFDKRQRVKGSTHPDLKIPSKSEATRNEYVEFKFRSNRLKSLRRVLRKRTEIFSNHDYIYFAYFLERGLKGGRKSLKSGVCIYYLNIIVFPKKVESISLKELIKNVKEKEAEFVKDLALESGLDLEEEELFGVGNMIKIKELERKVDEKDKIIKQLKKENEELKNKLNTLKQE